MTGEQEFQQRTEEIDRLVQHVNELADGDARTTALELLQAVMDLHGAGFARMIEVLRECGDAGQTALKKLGADPLLCGLMVLYEVHPFTMEERVATAVEMIRPRLRKHEAQIELLGVCDGVVRVEIHASGHGCHSSPDAVREQVEQAILEAAPETTQIVVEGIPIAAGGFVPINMVQPALKEERRYEKSSA
ncbi:MAG TPA: NifU family protein [candidate division Zixibacteria bacterium]|nr:NifU family protein [candidate division Zixibacteria bacterium]